MKKLISILFATIFISCNINQEVDYADFRVSGRVVEKNTNRPIENIQISLKNNTLGIFSKTLTNTNGQFLIKALNGGYVIDSVYVVAQDIDSIQNGYYEKDSIFVFLQKNDSGFEQAPASAENLLFQLNKLN